MNIHIIIIKIIINEKYRYINTKTFMFLRQVSTSVNKCDNFYKRAINIISQKTDLPEMINVIKITRCRIL